MNAKLLEAARVVVDGLIHDYILEKPNAKEIQITIIEFPDGQVSVMTEYKE